MRVCVPLCGSVGVEARSGSERDESFIEQGCLAFGTQTSTAAMIGVYLQVLLQR